MTDFNPVAHEHNLDVVIPRFGEVDTTDRILATLPGLAAMPLT
jgi:hypothetical protein